MAPDPADPLVPHPDNRPYPWLARRAQQTGAEKDASLGAPQSRFNRGDESVVFSLDCLTYDMPKLFAIETRRAESQVNNPL